MGYYFKLTTSASSHSPAGPAPRRGTSPPNRILPEPALSGGLSSPSVFRGYIETRSRRDGDGIRTGQSYTPYVNGQPGTAVITRYYTFASLSAGFGGAFETTGSTWKKYYFFAGQTVAMRDSTGLKYFLTDHPGSILAMSDSSGTLISQQRYMPFGQIRTDLGSISQTDFGYTGQRELDDGMGGIMDYKARFYSPYINHFLGSVTITHDPSDTQGRHRLL
jgi:hypothetical protein